MNKSTIIWIVSAIYGFTFGLVSNVYGLSTLQMLSLIMMSALFLVFYVWINLPSAQRATIVEPMSWDEPCKTHRTRKCIFCAPNQMGNNTP